MSWRRRKKKTSYEGDYGKGWSAGWSEYRYGRQGKPPALPRIFKGRDRQRIVGDVLFQLRDWRLTPFENEGAVRHGLRSAMCRQGHGWAAADSEAAGLIDAAFMRMGIKRPSWEQGQREYTIASENCNWCAGELDELQIMRRQRFCSTVCAKSALQYRDWQTTMHESTIGKIAYRMIARSQNPARPCAHCGQSFHPWSTGVQRYCSISCTNAAKIKLQRQCARPGCKKVFLPLSRGNEHFCSFRCRAKAAHNVKEITVACEQCTRPFVASRDDARFCGRRCRDRYRADRDAIAAGRQPRRVDEPITRYCGFCGETFSAFSTRAGYCTVNCRTIAQGFRSGGWRPKTMTRPVFDHLFTRPVNKVHQSDLCSAAEALDRLFAGGG